MKFANAGIVLLCSAGIWAQPQQSSLDYPLALKTRWTYHLHQENGEGVHFGEDLAALAKDNVVDASVISEVAGGIAGRKNRRTGGARSHDAARTRSG
jgi:hypothetical protein